MHVYNILKWSRSCSLMEAQEQNTNPSLNLTPHLCFLCTWHSFETCLLIRSLPFCGLFILLLSACSYKKQLQHFVKNNKCIRVLSIFFLISRFFRVSQKAKRPCFRDLPFEDGNTYRGCPWRCEQVYVQSHFPTETCALISARADISPVWRDWALVAPAPGSQWVSSRTTSQ